MSGGTDDDLVERLLTRDEGALREVVDAHSAAVFGIARRILENPGLAEEVAQDTFLAMWRRLLKKIQAWLSIRRQGVRRS